MTNVASMKHSSSFSAPLPRSSLATSVSTRRRRPHEHPDEHPDERRTFEALEAHIATLKEAVAKAEALAEQRRQEAETSSKRVYHLVAELVEMSMRMAEQTAVADKVRAEFDACRVRPWWRRLARSAA
jgi:chromosome segregation ATPase